MLVSGPGSLGSAPGRSVIFGAAGSAATKLDGALSGSHSSADLSPEVIRYLIVTSGNRVRTRMDPIAILLHPEYREGDRHRACASSA